MLGPAPASVETLYRPIRPPVGAPVCEAVHPHFGAPHALHAYRDAMGAALFYVARYESDGAQHRAMWSYDGQHWRAKQWPAPRPVYNLTAVAGDVDRPVLIVSDERTADLMGQLQPKRAAITWSGGLDALTHTDWLSLSGHPVTIWLDGGERYGKASNALAEILRGIASPLRRVDVGWEVSDWTLAAYIGAHDAAAVALYEREQSETLQEAIGAALRVNGASVHQEENAGSGALTLAPMSLSEPTFDSAQACWTHYGLSLGHGGRPWANMDNASRIIRTNRELARALWYDEFREISMLGDRALTDDDVRDLTVLLQSRAFLGQVHKDTVHDALMHCANLNKRHPVREWLMALPNWDKEARLSGLWVRTLGAEDNAYTQAVARNFMVGLIARVMEPGCQLDCMPVLESGKGGIGKTETLRILGGEWYQGATAKMGEKDFLQGLRGSWLIEIEELDAINRSTLESVKATLSRERDEYFARYGRLMSRVPRQNVFCGTTNSNTWNTDDSGARRFWPIECRARTTTIAARMAALKADKLQLFAEALCLYRAGAKWYEVPEEHAQLERDLRHIGDPWDDDIRGMLASAAQYGDPKLRLRDVLTQLDVRTKDMKSPDAYRVARIIKRMGWHRKRIKGDYYYVPNPDYQR